MVNKKGIIRENDKTAIYIENNIPRVPTNVAYPKPTTNLSQISQIVDRGGWMEVWGSLLNAGIIVYVFI